MDGFYNHIPQITTVPVQVFAASANDNASERRRCVPAGSYQQLDAGNAAFEVEGFQQMMDQHVQTSENGADDKAKVQETVDCTTLSNRQQLKSGNCEIIADGQ